MITVFRKIVSNPWCAALLCGAMLLSSCRDSISEKESISYSGEELFKAIFFGVGEAVNKIPTIQRSTRLDDVVDIGSELHYEVTVMQDLIVTNISKNTSSFYATFKQQIQSGNHVLINEAIISGAQEFSKALNRMTGLSTEALNQEIGEVTTKYEIINKDQTYSTDKIKKAIHDIQQGNPTGRTSEDACIEIILVVVLAVLLVALVNGAVAVHIAAAAIDVRITVTDDARTAKNNSLFIDNVVNDIAENLSY